MYYDELTNNKNQRAEHFKMKGIPNNAIIDHANKYFEESVTLQLYEGNEKIFD